MNNIAKGTERAIILWLRGVRLADIQALPEVKLLLDHSAEVELDPLPITGLQTQYYQVMSGRQPGSFGFFDTFVPRGYTVVEELIARDAHQLLPDLLRKAGWTVSYEEASVSEFATRVHHTTQSLTAPSSCLLATCAVEGSVGETSVSNIVQALQTARTWVGESGLLALLSDAPPVLIDRFVNINNFLVQTGVIERDGQSGLIDWSNSLAYHVGHGQLWINQLGREQQGVVHAQGEYEEVCDTLIKMLPAKCRDAETGEPVIERVYRKEELYPQEYLFSAPDLVVLFRPGYAPSPSSRHLAFDEAAFTTSIPSVITPAGVHPSMLTGFLLASSPAFAQGVAMPEHASLTAVAPTLLHALGVRHSVMDSAAIGALFSPSFLETHPIQTNVGDQELSDEEEEIVLGRLRDLGYL